MSRVCFGWVLVLAPMSALADDVDFVRDLQKQAVSTKDGSNWNWGPTPGTYSTSTSHSNRLIPIYTFGATLDEYAGSRSLYRDEQRLKELFGRLPDHTLNPEAEYLDQTDVYRLQKAAAQAGKKRIILFVFDGMDWPTTRAAAIYKTKSVGYDQGRGSGLHFLDYRGAPSDFGYFSTAPHNDGTDVDVDAQTVKNPGGTVFGGYDVTLGGPNPWTPGAEPQYLAGRNRERPHAVTDSANSATSMTSGIKTYNGSINVDADGKQSEPISRTLQRDRKMAVGVVTSVPISHATPAAAYANNVNRDDYQDLTRDLVGLPSIAHREALPGVDVLLGSGWGQRTEKAPDQGANFAPGGKYIADEDQQKIDQAHGGKYVVVERKAGVKGGEALAAAAQQAIDKNLRLYGIFGASAKMFGDHLPSRTADGHYDPTIGIRSLSENYAPADVEENPTLAEMTTAALDVLGRNPHGFWLMVEAGDVDWANHDNNLDNSIGSVISGDDAVKAATDWIEAHGGWDDTVLIVTADHGHYLNLNRPEALTGASASVEPK